MRRDAGFKARPMMSSRKRTKVEARGVLDSGTSGGNTSEEGSSSKEGSGKLHDDGNNRTIGSWSRVADFESRSEFRKSGL